MFVGLGWQTAMGVGDVGIGRVDGVSCSQKPFVEAGGLLRHTASVASVR
jgi:hypothetical protein